MRFLKSIKSKNFMTLFLFFSLLLIMLSVSCSIIPAVNSDHKDKENTEEITITLSAATLTFATPDLSQTLTATVTGTSTTTVAWTSSDAYIVSVNSSGVVTSIAGGSVTITAVSTADSSKSAVCTVTVSEPSRPATTDAVSPVAINGSNIQIIMCGDSIMRTYETTYGADRCGWGQVLQNFFNSDVAVDNTISNGGRSSRSFYNESVRWPIVKQKLAANQSAGIPTFVFIQFAHNDEMEAGSGGHDYLTFARNNQNGTVAGTFYDYLERYIIETRALGGIPVLFTPFARNYVESGEVTEKGKHNIMDIYSGETTARGNYPAAMTEIAAKHNVPCIDLTAWSANYIAAQKSAGNDGYVFSADSTHTRTLGALRQAEAAANGLSALGILSSKVITPNPRLMLDASTKIFGDVIVTPYEDTILNFKMANYNVTGGSLAISSNSTFFTLSLDNITFTSSVIIDCSTATSGATIYVKFIPLEKIAYSGTLTVTYTGTTAIIPDWGTSPVGTTDATSAFITLTGTGIESTVYTGNQFIMNASDLVSPSTLVDGSTIGTTVSGSTKYFTVNGSPTVDDNQKTVDGVTYYKRLKLGGSTYSISFTMAKGGTIKVVCQSSSGSADRKLGLYSGTDLTNAVYLFDAPGASPASNTTTVAAGGLYTLKSPASGVNIYYIEVNENE